MIGPRVRAANRSAAARSRAGVRIETTTRVLSGVHSSVEAGAMRSGLLIAMGVATPPAVGQTISEIAGVALASGADEATSIASRLPSREKAAWRRLISPSPSGSFRPPVCVSITTRRTAEGATYVGSP